MIVIDPVRTDTAEMADYHLQVRPGTDAWCLAALAAVLVQENLCDEAFLAEHVHGADEVRAVFADVPIADYAHHCGVGKICCARRPGESRPRAVPRYSRISASSRGLTALCVRTSTRCCGS